MTVDGGLSLDIDLSELEDVIGDLDVYPSWLGREMTMAMDLALHHLVGHVAKRTPVFSGTLRRGWGQSNISPWPNLVGLVSNPVKDYPIVIERGRKFPGKPPPSDALKLWVQRVLGVSAEESDSVAFLVARSIGKHGFSRKGKVGPTGAKMAEEGLEAATPNILRLFDRAIDKSIKRFNAA
jgi:hypothetical protein